MVPWLPPHKRLSIRPEDFAVWTGTWSTEMIGAFLLLVLEERRRLAPLPDDDAEMSALLNIPAEKWRGMRALFLKKTIRDIPVAVVRDGVWSSPILADWVNKGPKMRHPGMAPPPGRQFPPNWRALRNLAFERDGYACVYCGDKSTVLHCDHVVPVNRGGTDDLENLATACQPCNQSKRDKPLDEWLAKRRGGSA